MAMNEIDIILKKNPSMYLEGCNQLHTMKNTCK